MHKMKKLITILVIIIPILIFGQDTKEIVVKFPNSKQIRERYNVLKSNKKIKKGEYIRYFKSAKQEIEKKFIHTKGSYIKRKKNGEWEFYKNPTQGHPGLLLSTEYYELGIKTGVWETYHYEKEGLVIEKFDYYNNSPLQPLISVSLNYPMLAKEKGIQGIVIIEYKMLNDCSVKELKIIKGIDPECDQEAINSIINLSILQKKHSIEKCEEQILTKSFNFFF